MLEKLGEWYRIVTPSPRHEDLEKRKASIDGLLSKFTEKRKVLIPEAVSGLVWQFDSSMEVASVLTDAIRTQDLSFPTGIEENDLELKVVTALTLGEIMSNPRAKKARPFTATFMISALGIPRDMHSQRKHFAEMLKALRSLAVDVLDQEADAARRIPSLSAQSVNIAGRFDEMEEAARASDVPNQPLQLWLAVAPVLRQVLESFQERLSALELVQRVDREELEVLWWSYSGHSKTTGKPFSLMSLGDTALCAGCELASICLMPPLPNARYLLQDAVSRGRKKAPQDKSLESIVLEWSEPVLVDSAQGDSVTAQELAKKYPAVLPISWVTQRLVESRMKADWTDEFEAMTGIKKDVTLSVARWAEQVLWEQVAWRVYKE